MEPAFTELLPLVPACLATLEANTPTTIDAYPASSEKAKLGHLHRAQHPLAAGIPT